MFRLLAIESRFSYEEAGFSWVYVACKYPWCVCVWFYFCFNTLVVFHYTSRMQSSGTDGCKHVSMNHMSAETEVY